MAARANPLLGCTEPRVFTKPLRKLTPKTTRGFEVIAFAEDVLGVTLTPGQKWLYVHALELLPNGRYRFRTILILIARQNGKTLWAQVLALWALYLDGATLVLGTAQNLDIAEECWQGSVDIAEGVPDLAAEIADVNRTNGKKALVLTGGERYKVQAANRRGGRSLTVKLAILDELREHQTWDAWGAITKTTMAQRDGLVVALTNAGDDKSVVLNDQQERATSRVDDPETTIAIFEWSGAPGCDINDPQAQAQANPSVGYTDLTIEAIRAAAESDPEPIYRTEVLCQHVAQIVPSALPAADWANLADEASEVQDGAYLVFGVDLSWDRSVASVAVAGTRADGLVHVQVIGVLDPTTVVAWLRERVRRWAPIAVTLQGTGAPASSLANELEGIGCPVHPVNGSDVVKAAGLMYDAIKAGRVRHLGDPALHQQVELAVSRKVGQAWALDRRDSPIDISGLVAVTEALWVLDELVGSADYDVSASVA